MKRWSMVPGPTHRTVWSRGRNYWGTSPFYRWACPPTILPPPAASQRSCRLCWTTAHPHWSVWSWSEPSPSAARLRRSRTSPVRPARGKLLFRCKPTSKINKQTNKNYTYHWFRLSSQRAFGFGGGDWVWGCWVTRRWSTRLWTWPLWSTVCGDTHSK